MTAPAFVLFAGIIIATVTGWRLAWIAAGLQRNAGWAIAGLLAWAAITVFALTALFTIATR